MGVEGLRREQGSWLGSDWRCDLNCRGVYLEFLGLLAFVIAVWALAVVGVVSLV